MVNRITIIGNVGTVRFDDFKEFDSGSRKMRFAVATSERFKNKEGEYDKKTIWHQVECWNATADFCNKYMQTGSLVYVCGSMEVNEYEIDGEKKKRMFIKAREVRLLKTKEDVNSSKNEDSQDDIPF